MASIVSLAELLDAYEWVSATIQYQNAAYLERATGAVFVDAEEYSGVPLPADYEDATKYIAVPHKNDLNLGRELVKQFVEEFLPNHSGQIRNIFRERGAYSRLKALLERQGQLSNWHRYEADAVNAALRNWAEVNGFLVGPDKPLRSGGSKRNT